MRPFLAATFFGNMLEGERLRVCDFSQTAKIKAAPLGAAQIQQRLSHLVQPLGFAQVAPSA